MKTLTISPNSKTKLPDMTPDEALEILRSMVFAYERSMTAESTCMSPMSQEAAESFTEDEHAAIAVLQQYIDYREDGIEAKLAAGRKSYQEEKKSGEWKET